MIAASLLVRRSGRFSDESFLPDFGQTAKTEAPLQNPLAGHLLHTDGSAAYQFALISMEANGSFTLIAAPSPSTMLFVLVSIGGAYTPLIK